MRPCVYTIAVIGGLLTFLHPVTAYGQLLDGARHRFTLADTLRGSLSERRDYDVTYYDLNVRIDPEAKTVSGTVLIAFIAGASIGDTLQIDLWDNMQIQEITGSKGQVLSFRRVHHAVFIGLDKPLQKNQGAHLEIAYGGEPKKAKLPPWDGGFVWRKDRNKNPWIGVACEGEGASLWWPCKDHLSDEPDSMRIRVAVPETIMNISNGRLEDTLHLGDGYIRWDWVVKNPINTYNVTVNAAAYSHFSDTFYSPVDSQPLSLDYYVLPNNLEKAKVQFEQVKPMLECFENLYGKYPFYQDGFKLVETAYLGMEHQSAIAYGNNYKTGYYGRDFSGIGLDFDYIIIHETGHEWWGNAVSCKDIADLWIHEGFCSYSDALYVECIYGREAYLGYMATQMGKIANDRPVAGPYGVNEEGSSDMYAKGAAMLHTLRMALQDEELFLETISAFYEQFKYQTLDAEDVIQFFDAKLNTVARFNVRSVFEQYLYHAEPPVLHYRIDSVAGRDAGSVTVKWESPVKGFDMPVTVKNPAGIFQLACNNIAERKHLLAAGVKDFEILRDYGYFVLREME